MNMIMQISVEKKFDQFEINFFLEQSYKEINEIYINNIYLLFIIIQYIKLY